MRRVVAFWGSIVAVILTSLACGNTIKAVAGGEETIVWEVDWGKPITTSIKSNPSYTLIRTTRFSMPTGVFPVVVEDTIVSNPEWQSESFPEAPTSWLGSANWIALSFHPRFPYWTFASVNWNSTCATGVLTRYERNGQGQGMFRVDNNSNTPLYFQSGSEWKKLEVGSTYSWGPSLRGTVLLLPTASLTRSACVILHWEEGMDLPPTPTPGPTASPTLVLSPTPTPSPTPVNRTYTYLPIVQSQRNP